MKMKNKFAKKEKRKLDANRKFFLKWLPFNFCDRFCERCDDFRSECKIYEDHLNFQARCIMEGKDPNDTKVIFEEVGRSLAETMRMVSEIIEKEGIKLTKKDEEEYFRESERKQKAIMKTPLHQKSALFFKKTAELLDKFPVPFGEELPATKCLMNEIKELGFYSPMVAVKTDRALYSKIEEEKYPDNFPRPDSLVAASLAYYSLLACLKSLKALERLASDLTQEREKIKKIEKIGTEAQKEFEKVFPKVKNFRNKIIFHGKI